MKVLYIVTAYDRHPGDGITPWLVETIRRLRSRRIEVEVLAPSYRGLESGRIEGVMVHRFRYAPAAVEDLTHDQTAPDRVRERPLYLGLLPGYVAAASLAARALVRGGTFDLVHVHWPLPHVVPGWAARAASGIPLVITFHGVEMTFARTAPIPFLESLLRRAIRTADAVTANSTYTAGLVRSVYDRPVEVVPFGSTVPVPEAAPPTPPAPPFRLLFVGRLVERKGVRYLLEAVRAARERVAVVLDVVGEGPLRVSLEARARELGLEEGVRFHGFVTAEELAGRYERCHAFVLPAVVDEKGDVEGLGVVLIEALAYGRPAIGSEAGGIVDVVRHRETGLRVPPADVPALTEAIVELATDPESAARLGRQGREYVQRHYGWDTVIERLDALYEGVRDSSRRAHPGGSGTGS
ncbi:MAG: glycosyltransferase family 4 protein [Gemmatimonadota bacterium]